MDIILPRPKPLISGVRQSEASPDTHTGTIRQHDALAATLADAEKAGHDPKALLEEAASWRELDTARDTTDVLVWRIRRIADLPANPGQPGAAKAGTARTRPAPGRTGARVEAQPAAQPVAGTRRPAPGR